MYLRHVGNCQFWNLQPSDFVFKERLWACLAQQPEGMVMAVISSFPHVRFILRQLLSTKHQNSREP